MKNSLILLLLLSSTLLSAQSSINYKLGFSFHGTGDLYGFSNSLSYQSKRSEKLSYNLSFTNTDHFRTQELRWIDTAGQVFQRGYEVNADYRFNTYGYQLNPSVQYNFVRGAKTNLYINVGGIVRFQRQNITGVTYIFYITVPDLKVPLIINDDQKYGIMWTVGYLVGIGLNRQVNEKWGYSIDFIELQNDTQGQIIWKLPQIGVTRYLND